MKSERIMYVLYLSGWALSPKFVEHFRKIQFLEQIWHYRMILAFVFNVLLFMRYCPRFLIFQPVYKNLWVLKFNFK